VEMEYIDFLKDYKCPSCNTDGYLIDFEEE